MPELPEVETVARQLATSIIGERVEKLEFLDSKLVGDGVLLAARTISSVQRLGKQVVLFFSGSPLFVSVHLRMTGRLIWEPKKLGKPFAASEPRYVFEKAATEKSLRAIFHCTHGCLKFYDTRRFGTIELSTSLEKLTPRGLEPLSDACTWEALWQLLNRSHQPLKQWLLRQDRLVGIGNIYASEILFAAKLHPQTPAGGLSKREVQCLHREMQRILQEAIDNCGTTFSDFQDTSGSLGSYQNFLQVYGREGERCTRCRRGLIQRLTQGGRSTFYCERCQKMPRS